VPAGRKSRTSGTASLPVQQSIAEMGIELESIAAQVEQVAANTSDGVDYGMAWPIQLYAAKYKALEEAKRIVDLAMDRRSGRRARVGHNTAAAPTTAGRAGRGSSDARPGSTSRRRSRGAT
jgi:hypothetical protein